ncbi:Uncharacterized protein TCM_044835 [Theobroma cacao]|uniref:Uncharacterized protein n=1 Tax=Theobroma cacao TaxID=3641 RepID=A0A061FY20_THECC|nr:Uncharacterized protein TCM_044835 [Theobroma cacao]
MRKLMLSLAGFRSAFGVMSAYRDVAEVVTGPMGVPGRDKNHIFCLYLHGERNNHIYVNSIYNSNNSLSKRDNKIIDRESHNQIEWLRKRLLFSLNQLIKLLYDCLICLTMVIVSYFFCHMHFLSFLLFILFFSFR